MKTVRERIPDQAAEDALFTRLHAALDKHPALVIRATTQVTRALAPDWKPAHLRGSIPQTRLLSALLPLFVFAWKKTAPNGTDFETWVYSQRKHSLPALVDRLIQEFREQQKAKTP